MRNPSAYVVRSVENAHCHGGGGSLRPQPPPGAVYYVPYYNYGPPPPPNESPPGFAPSPAAPAFVPQAPYETPPPPAGEDESDATDDGEQKDPCDALDPKASAALANLPEKEADRILDNLRRKGDSVRNPSAYVMRSILNSNAEPSCQYATEELPDIEEVPRPRCTTRLPARRASSAMKWRSARGRRRSTTRCAVWKSTSELARASMPSSRRGHGNNIASMAWGA